MGLLAELGVASSRTWLICSHRSLNGCQRAWELGWVVRTIGEGWIARTESDMAGVSQREGKGQHGDKNDWTWMVADVEHMRIKKWICELNGEERAGGWNFEFAICCQSSGSNFTKIYLGFKGQPINQNWFKDWYTIGSLSQCLRWAFVRHKKLHWAQINSD